MSEKFFEIANAIYKGKLPASFFCIVMPNSLFLGTICSQDEIVKFLETDALGMDKNSPMDKAIQQISAKMTFLESADKNPTALQEKIVTMVR